MTFSFTNAITSELSKSPIEGLINNLMGGYEQGAKLRYLKPGLEEELKKSRLYNQYYGPNMESQMGLRGAQAGLLGEQTKSAHTHNQYLPEQLKAQMEANKFKSQNPLMGMSGSAGQIGALMYLQQHPELMQNANNLSSMQGQGNPGINPFQNIQQGQSYLPSIAPQANISSPQSQPSYLELLQQSIQNSLKQTTKQTPLEQAENYYEKQRQQYGKDSTEAKTASEYVDKVAHGTRHEKNDALEKHRETQDNMAIWKSLPKESKASAIALGQGAGFSSDETVRWLASGKSMKDLLYQHGIKDESQVNPVYQLTGAAQTQLLQREFASKEADHLAEYVRKNTGEYARTVAGYSPKLMKDQLAGKNEDKQAKLLAARALSSELVNLRLVLANAKSTVHAQKRLAENSMLDMKNFRSLVTPKVWGKMQEEVDKELHKMFKHAKTGFGQKIATKLKEDHNKKSENDPLGIR